MSNENNETSENQSVQQAAQEIVNGGISGTTAGSRSVSFLSLSELDNHELHVERKNKGRNPASGIVRNRMTGGTPRY